MSRKTPQLLVIGANGGRRFIAASHLYSEAAGVALAGILNDAQRRILRRPGQTVTRYALYKLVESK